MIHSARRLLCRHWLTGTQVREDHEPQCILSISTDLQTEIGRSSLLPRPARLPALYATSPDAVCQAADITKKALNFEHSTPIGVTCLKFNAFNFLLYSVYHRSTRMSSILKNYFDLTNSRLPLWGNVIKLRKSSKGIRSMIERRK